MIVKTDYKRFQGLLNKYCPDTPVTEEEAAEAFHNLVGFVSILMQVNDRVELVPPDDPKQ